MASTFLEYQFDAEAKRLVAQDSTLGSLRNRAVWLLSIVSVLVSVSVAAGRIATDSKKGPLVPYSTAILLIGILAGMAVTVALILAPWPFFSGPRKGDFGIKQTTADGAEDTMLAVSAAISKMSEEIKSNQTVLCRIQAGLVLCSVLLAAEIGILLWLAAR